MNALEIAELFHRVRQDAEFDVAEMSVSTFLMMRGAGGRSARWFARVPVRGRLGTIWCL